MKKFIALVIFILTKSFTYAEGHVPDTVYAGIYLTSIHDIDFKQKEYKADFWLWLNYENKEFNFADNLEIPQAKSFIKSFTTSDTTDGKIFLLMKLQCVMKDSWKIENFPFDRQKLRLTIENSQFDNRSFVFAIDTLGKHYDPRFTLNGWKIDSFDISIGSKVYESGFGDPDLKIPRTEYSAFKVKIGLNRDSLGLFWKLFLGMFVAFLIAYVSFYIHSDGIDSRFSLSVGALFAVIGNKYIIDSSLPESITFTLVDTLHGLTLVFILAIISATAFSLKLVKNNKIKQASRFDMIAAQTLITVYLILNIYFISKAMKG